ncbi:AraC family transcriptional regulator [Niveibacterium sp. SC-1]|uniref:AraC family transcriptional regulator n=1 Tax=Niveibacterium sp. SC-1 TaxID=3135646 RepID=UPI00311DC0DA
MEASPELEPQMDAMDELRSLIARHCRGLLMESAVPGLHLLHADAPCQPVNVIYEPKFCVIASGRKDVQVGEQMFSYTAGQYLLVSVDLPVSGWVREASTQAPYLALSVRLDPRLLAELVLARPPRGKTAEDGPAIAISDLNAGLLDPLLRLVRLLDTPGDIAALAPLYERELAYRLLQGDQADMLRQIATQQGRMAQIARAIRWIRSHYAEPLEIEALAGLANLSVSAFHRHFKQVTTLSPLQYQKNIRLQEARHRLFSAQADAASVGFAVGYESPSQFSREYRRMFGAPPLQDARAARQVQAA